MDIKKKLKKTHENLSELKFFHGKIKRYSKRFRKEILVIFFKHLVNSIFREIGGTGMIPGPRETLIVRICEECIKILKEES